MSVSFASWQRVWRDLDGREADPALFHALVAAYSEKQRHYHTLQHLRECMERLDEARSLAERPADVELALWFHDAVYDVHGSQNEALSARCGRPLVVTTVAARSRGKDRGVTLEAARWYDDPVALARDAEIDVFVELMGGAGDPAKAAIEAALGAGKAVVTANKALLARHGVALAAKAEAAGVPTLPGYRGADQSEARLLAEAESLGVPFLVKASAGGGGRGMRLVTELGAAAEAIRAAKAEARAAFGDATVFLERYAPRARHVEVQILGDSYGHVVHLWDRDCSLQRNHQKLVEEAPVPGLRLPGVKGCRRPLHRVPRALPGRSYALPGAIRSRNAGDARWRQDLSAVRPHDGLPLWHLPHAGRLAPGRQQAAAEVPVPPARHARM